MAELILLILLLALYLLPAIIGSNKSDAGSIFLFNLLAGWTLLGWLGALIWAVSKEAQPAPAVVQHAASTPIPVAAPARAVASEDVHPTQVPEQRAAPLPTPTPTPNTPPVGETPTKQSINPSTEDYQHYYPHHNTQEIVFDSHLNGLLLCRLAVKPHEQDESDKQNDCDKRYITPFKKVEKYFAISYRT